MCGICGIVHTQKDFYIPESTLVAMCDSMEHRGPDDAGSYIADGVGLGSRRLAILDLSARGHMPMATRDQRLWITYNGEIYNFQELELLLTEKGYVFSSNTDTEVLLYMYAEYGPRMLDYLNGMFAFAIWNSESRSLFVARDRLGIKPLYYALHGGALVFASEEKALFTAGIPFSINPEIWEELLYFRYLAGERTPFIGVKRLLPGHYFYWENGNLDIKRWWNLSERASAVNLPKDPDHWFAETFDSSVDIHRISDVPVGVLLSGGLDSSSVVASISAQSTVAPASFTVSFSEAGYDETQLARQIAEQWHLDFHNLTIQPGKLFDLASDALWYNDEPQAHANDAHLLAISRYAKPLVTVLLSGEGADEMLGGYVRYRILQYTGAFPIVRPLVQFTNLVPGTPARLKRRLEKLERFTKLQTLDLWVAFNSCDVLPGDLPLRKSKNQALSPFREGILAEAKALYPKDRVRQVMYYDQHTFLCSVLDRNDKMTMGASIECRVPFLDYRLVETLAALPSEAMISRRENKHLLRTALGKRLPKAILHNRKWGFGVPWKDYLRHIERFAEVVRKLPRSEVVDSISFESGWLETTVDDFFRGNDQHTAIIHQLALLSIWYDTLKQRIKTSEPLLVK